MSINANVYLHGLEDVDKILHKLKHLEVIGEHIMATLDELVGVVDEVLNEVGKVGPAVDALEAKVTEALKGQGISAEAQAKIDAAVTKLRTVVTNVSAAVADASDGLDEATIVPPAPAEEPPVV